MNRLPRKTRREWKAQNGNGAGVCAICFSTTRRTGLDHCHATGRIRGVLCLNCNSGLGMFGDSIERLKQAVRYLTLASEETPSTEWLTVRQAAAKLGMSTNAVYTACREGQLPHKRIGTRIRISEESCC
jgi:excisionase family DNA binding protein